MSNGQPDRRGGGESRRISERKLIEFSWVKERDKSVFLSWLPGMTMNKKMAGFPAKMKKFLHAGAFGDFR